MHWKLGYLVEGVGVIAYIYTRGEILLEKKKLGCVTNVLFLLVRLER